MVKLLKQSSICCTSKTQGSTGGLQRHNEREPSQRHSVKNIKPDRTKDNIFLKPKDDRTHGELGWMTVWRLDTGAKRFGRRSQDGGNNGYNLGAISPESEECKSRR